MSERGFASDNSATVHPGRAGRDRARQRGPRVRLRPRRVHPVGRGRCRRAVRRATRGRSSCSTARARQRALAARRLPAVGGRDLRRERAHQRRRVRRARGDRRRQAADRAPATDGKLTPELVESRIARIGDEHVVQPRLRLDLAVHRARRRCTRRTSCGRWPTLAHAARAAAARRRRPAEQRRGGARRLAARRSRPPPAPTSSRSAAPRTGCWAPRRSSLLQPEPGATDSCTCASRRCSSPRRCASSPRSSTRCSPTSCGGGAPPTPTRWRRGSPTRSRTCRTVTITRPVQTNVVFATLPGRDDRALQERVRVLRLGRARRRGPLDVLVGHDRGRRRRVRRRDP